MKFLDLFKKKLIEKGIPEDKVEKIVDKTNEINIVYEEDLINKINFLIGEEITTHFPNLKLEEYNKLKSQRRMKIAVELYKSTIMETPEFLGELKNQLEFILKAINSDLEKKKDGN